MEVLARVGTELDVPVLVELYQNFRETLRGERGAGGLDVPVLPGIRESKNFLEGAGLVARLLVMHRRLN